MNTQEIVAGKGCFRALQDFTGFHMNARHALIFLKIFDGLRKFDQTIVWCIATFRLVQCNICFFCSETATLWHFSATLAPLCCNATFCVSGVHNGLCQMQQALRALKTTVRGCFGRPRVHAGFPREQTTHLPAPINFLLRPTLTRGTSGGAGSSGPPGLAWRAA